MEKQLEKSTEDKFFISAINQEVFNRIFPHIRHDLVGYMTTSLMRVSIMDRYLNKAELAPEQVKSDLKKIELQLRDAILGIRELQLWDFESAHEDQPGNILKKSTQLMNSQLAMKNIQLTLPDEQLDNDSVADDALKSEVVKTKPLLYCLLCLFSYIEDNNFDNKNLNMRLAGKSMVMSWEPIAAQDSMAIKINRNLLITEELIIRFAKFYLIDINFQHDQIMLTWE